jgi:hypothetical protein
VTYAKGWSNSISVVCFVLALLAVQGCVASESWTLDAYNSHGTDPIGVRVRSQSSAPEWILLPSQFATLLVASQPVAGSIELFDPETCKALVSKPIPEGPGALAIMGRGVTGGGDWEFSVEADDPSSDPVSLATRAKPCEGPRGS